GVDVAGRGPCRALVDVTAGGSGPGPPRVAGAREGTWGVRACCVDVAGHRGRALVDVRAGHRGGRRVTTATAVTGIAEAWARHDVRAGAAAVGVALPRGCVGHVPRR